MISQPEFNDFEDVADKKVACSLTIYENTCAEWQTAAHGCFSQSMVVTTVYATLGESAVVDAVNELHSNTLLCNRKSVEKLAKHLSKVMRGVRGVDELVRLLAIVLHLEDLCQFPCPLSAPSRRRAGASGKAGARSARLATADFRENPRTKGLGDDGSASGSCPQSHAAWLSGSGSCAGACRAVSVERSMEAKVLDCAGGKSAGDVVSLTDSSPHKGGGVS